MRKKLVLFSTLIALLLVSGGYVIGGAKAYTHYQQNMFALQQHCGDQRSVHVCVSSPAVLFSAFYPSYFATHTPLCTVEYNSSTPLGLRVSVGIRGFTDVEEHQVIAGPKLQSLHFIPPVQAQALSTLTEDEHVSLHIEVSDVNRQTLYYVNDIPLLLRSRWLMLWTKTNRYQIAAWVTPNDHAVSDLVTQAAGLLKTQHEPLPPGMVGYSGASEQQVIDQVNAIYDAVRSRTMKYVNTSVAYNGSDDSTAMQIIKLPEEVLKQHSGMCIELTVLLASAAEHIGLHSEIVIIPGHAFLGVATRADNTRFQYWDVVGIDSGIAGDSSNIAAAALYAKNAAQHSIVDTLLISDARAMGIGPML